MEETCDGTKIKRYRKGLQMIDLLTTIFKKDIKLVPNTRTWVIKGYSKYRGGLFWECNNKRFVHCTDSYMIDGKEIIYCGWTQFDNARQAAERIAKIINEVKNKEIYKIKDWNLLVKEYMLKQKLEDIKEDFE